MITVKKPICGRCNEPLTWKSIMVLPNMDAGYYTCLRCEQ